jgi:hypothetical protein
MRAGSAFLVALAALAAVPSAARADDGGSAAETLFQEARTLAAAGRYAEACRKLEQSYALEPAVGTQFNLADCYEHVGRIASAWRFFVKVEAAAHAAAQAEREIRAHDRAAELVNRVAKLTIEVPPAARAPDLRVTADGEAVLPTSYGVGIAVDVGAHHIAAQAPGLLPWREDVQVPSDGAAITVRVPVLELAPAPSPAPAAAAEPVPPDPGSDGGGRRTVGYAVGGVGIVGVASGAIFGGLSVSKHT